MFLINKRQNLAYYHVRLAERSFVSLAIAYIYTTNFKIRYENDSRDPSLQRDRPLTLVISYTGITCVCHLFCRCIPFVLQVYATCDWQL